MAKKKTTEAINREQEVMEEKEALPSFFSNLFSSTSKPLQQKGAGVQHHAFGTGENQYRRLQVDDEGGQENGRGHQAQAALHHTQRAAQGKLQEAD